MEDIFIDVFNFLTVGTGGEDMVRRCFEGVAYSVSDFVAMLSGAFVARRTHFWKRRF